MIVGGSDEPKVTEVNASDYHASISSETGGTTTAYLRNNLGVR